MSRIKDRGSLHSVVKLGDEDVSKIALAYTIEADAKRSDLYRRVFGCPMDPIIKVRLLVPGIPKLTHRCLRAELLVGIEVSDFICLNEGFDVREFVLQIPGQIRLVVSMDYGPTTTDLTRLPIPKYD